MSTIEIWRQNHGCEFRLTDFFFKKNMVASSFCNDRKSAFRHRQSHQSYQSWLSSKIVMQIFYCHASFLLFSDNILQGQKPLRDDKLLHGGAPCPAPLWKKARKNTSYKKILPSSHLHCQVDLATIVIKLYHFKDLACNRQQLDTHCSCVTKTTYWAASIEFESKTACMWNDNILAI